MAEYPAQGVWCTPKTNWRAGDVFELVPDYLRIVGNVLALNEQLTQLRAPLPQELLCPQERDAVDVAILSAVESAAINAAQQSGFAFSAVSYQPEGPVWTAEHLNEIEAALGMAHDRLPLRIAGRRRLALRLGGVKGAV